jgi:hypothetical protein
MMSDIVKRLRATAEIAKNLGVEGGLSETAADEIERLRERLAEADEANRKVSDANENLRAALIGVTSELETFVSIFKGYQGMTMNNASAAIRAAKAALGESDD